MVWLRCEAGRSLEYSPEELRRAPLSNITVANGAASITNANITASESGFRTRERGGRAAWRDPTSTSDNADKAQNTASKPAPRF